MVLVASDRFEYGASDAPKKTENTREEEMINGPYFLDRRRSWVCSPWNDIEKPKTKIMATRV